MNLIEIYNAARVQEPGLAAARAATDAERERLPMAQSQFYPNVSANFSQTRNQLSSTTPNFLGTETTTETNYPSQSKNLVMRQPLYRPQIWSQYRQAQSQVRDAEAVLVQEEQNLAVRVTSAYFDALLARDQLQLITTAQTQLQTQLDVARKIYASGAGIRTDVDEALARFDMNHAQRLEAQQNVAYTLQQLQAMIDQPIDQIANLDEARFVPIAPADTLQTWIDRANAYNPQLLALQERLESTRLEISKAGAGHLPSLDAVAQWSDSLSESVTNLSTRYMNRSIGLQLSMPIFAGGYVNAAVRQALANTARAEKILEASRREVAGRVHQEYRAVTESVAKIQALGQALRSADQMLSSTQKSFLAGSRTVLDIANAQQQKRVVLRDLAQTRYIHLVSKVRLLSLVGGVDLEAINQVLQNDAGPGS
jgi:outer membrane protein/protease secretion system outer membrane protein